MALSRVCSECPNLLTERQKYTCGDTCRGRRSRRLKRTRAAAGEKRALPEHQSAVAEAVRWEAADIAHTVLQEELRPIVREAITADVLRSINSMVALAPAVVMRLAEDLDSPDSKIRQKAYDLWLRYTVGHQAIVRPAEGDDSKNLTVNFNLPRPDGSTIGDVIEDDPSEALELRTCNLCSEEKPAEQFVAASDRCEDCHEKMQLEVARRLQP